MKLSDAIRAGIPHVKDSDSIVAIAYRAATGQELYAAPVWAAQEKWLNREDIPFEWGRIHGPYEKEMIKLFPALDCHLKIHAFWKTLTRLIGKVAMADIQRQCFPDRRHRECVFSILENPDGATVWDVLVFVFSKRIVPLRTLATALELHGF